MMAMRGAMMTTTPPPSTSTAAAAAATTMMATITATFSSRLHHLDNDEGDGGWG